MPVRFKLYRHLNIFWKLILKNLPYLLALEAVLAKLIFQQTSQGAPLCPEK
jgi:hypothetical protein